MRDVWITGMGAVTPLGIGVAPYWQACLEGRSGIKPIQKFNTQGLAFVRGAEIEPLAADQWLDPEETGRLSRLAAAALSAARQALADARLLSEERRSRLPSLAVLLGTSNGGLNDGENYLRREPEETLGAGFRERQPYAFLTDMARALGLREAQGLNTNTCAAAGYAVSLAADLIRLERAEAVLCGAADLFAEVVQAGFANLRALAPSCIRPFDRGREGTMLGDAAAMFLLESADSARSRNARPWARLAGEGWSADAYHISAPRPRGEGLETAMRRALQAARLAPAQISCVVAHGTGTPSNDRAEARALQAVFGPDLPPVTAFKPRVGHSQGAAQAVDILSAALMLREGQIPPVSETIEMDPDCPLPVVVSEPKAGRLETCMVNAMGFGGNNLSLILQQAESGPA
ncbi:MAG: beta-ketoacyl-[acyl-carrier-protein] synthase family protein [candidate division FCPU426 bacterium]